MRVSQAFLLSAKGDRLIFRDYEHQSASLVDEVFFRKYCYWKGEAHNAAPAGDCPPFFVEMGVYYYFLRVRKIFFVCTSAEPLPPNSIICAMQQMVSVMRDLLGVFNEQTVRSNFTVIYEFLDEAICFGVLQDVRTDKLKPYILHRATDAGTTETLFDRLRRMDYDDTMKRSDASAVPILRHADGSSTGGGEEETNEIYVDVVERLQVLFNAAGNVRRAQVEGAIVVKSLLQGSPVLKIGLSSNRSAGGPLPGFDTSAGGIVPLDSIAFHQTVDYSRFEQERLLTVRPSLGSSTLAVYHTSASAANFRPPFRVIHVAEQTSAQRAEVALRARAEFDGTITAINVRVDLHLPLETSTATMEFAKGQDAHTFEFREADGVLSWVIPKFSGGTEVQARARLFVDTADAASLKRGLGPITMHFEIPQHSVTGMAIHTLQALERGSEYNPAKWIRNITQASSYEFRLH